MIKTLTFFLVILFACLSMLAKGQASSSSDFQLKVEFPKSVSVKKMEVAYFNHDGNQFNSISYTTDIKNNTITVSGNNDYVLWVSFPVMVFYVRTNTKNPGKPVNFFLVSQGPLSSYTGKQTKSFKFTMENTVMVASLEVHNHENAHQDLSLTWLPGDKAGLYIAKESLFTQVYRK